MYKCKVTQELRAGILYILSFEKNVLKIQRKLFSTVICIDVVHRNEARSLRQNREAYCFSETLDKSTDNYAIDSLGRTCTSMMLY